MITLSKDQFLKKAVQRGYITARIYEGNFKTVDGLKSFERIEEDTPEEFIDKITEFIDEYPHRFTFVCRSTKNVNNKYEDLVNVHFVPIQTLENVPNTAISDVNMINRTPEQIEAEIRARIELEVKVKQETEERERIQNQLDELNTTGGKLANVGYQILMQFLAPAQPDTSASLQGIDPNELEESIARLIEVLGADTLIKLSHKIKPGDPMIQMVKNYANG
jgi:hypothetical protein